VPESGPARRAADLTNDTTAEAERMQVEAWRGMSPLDKARLVSQITQCVVNLALAGIRHRHPGASERECFLRIAALKLGPALARSVYPDAARVLGPDA
jgi:hypothetical protein